MKAQNSSQEDSAKLYASISLLVGNNVLICKKKSSCFQNDQIIDFSKEHQLKINKDMLEKYEIKIQIKKTTSIGVKSKNWNNNWIHTVFFSDEKLAETIIGPNQKDTASKHYMKMLESPNEWIFMWHDLQSKSLNKNP